MPPPCFLVNQTIKLNSSAEATDPSRNCRQTLAPPGVYRIVNFRRYEGYGHDPEHGDGYVYRIKFSKDGKEFTIWQNKLLDANPTSDFPKFP